MIYRHEEYPLEPPTGKKRKKIYDDIDDALQKLAIDYKAKRQTVEFREDRDVLAYLFTAQAYLKADLS